MRRPDLPAPLLLIADLRVMRVQSPDGVRTNHAHASQNPSARARSKAANPLPPAWTSTSTTSTPAGVPVKSEVVVAQCAGRERRFRSDAPHRRDRPRRDRVVGVDMPLTMRRQSPTISGYLPRLGRGIPAFVQVNGHP